MLLHDSAGDEDHRPLAIERAYLVGVHLGELIHPRRRRTVRARGVNPGESQEHYEDLPRSACHCAH